jgi:probable HAF family extracellular repeat protein
MITKTMRLAVMVTMWAVLGLATAGAAQTPYTITDLGTLPGTTGCTPYGLNDVGEVVGACAGSASFSEMAFVWRHGTMTGLGKLPRGRYSDAWAITRTRGAP